MTEEQWRYIVQRAQEDESKGMTSVPTHLYKELLTAARHSIVLQDMLDGQQKEDEEELQQAQTEQPSVIDSFFVQIQEMNKLLILTLTECQKTISGMAARIVAQSEILTVRAQGSTSNPLGTATTSPGGE